MRVSIFGLGYVGCVSIACLSKSGHEVIGFDVDQAKVDKIQNGIPTIVEKSVSEYIAENKERIKATMNPGEAVHQTDISVICVGTPGSEDGLLDHTYIYEAAKQIGIALKNKKDFHVVSIRSTVKSGTNFEVVSIIEKESGKACGVDFDVVNNPEFLREGTAVKDYFDPPVTVIGVRDKNSKAAKMMTELYSDVSGKVMYVDTKSAEIIKYVNNSWHALKIVFANEVGSICKELGINSQEVMDIFCEDRKLNLSPYYCKPGFAYGGPCLNKDLRGFVGLAKKENVEVPLLANVERSNNFHVERVMKQIRALKPKSIAYLGISFKAGTDDLRFSTKLELAKLLKKEGFKIKVHDLNVTRSLEEKINNHFILSAMEDLKEDLEDNLDQTLAGADVVVFAHNESFYDSLGERLREDQILFELSKYRGEFSGARIGVCW